MTMVLRCEIMEYFKIDMTKIFKNIRVNVKLRARIVPMARIGLVILVLGLWPWIKTYAEEPKTVRSDGHLAGQETAQDKANLGPNAIPRGPDDVSARIETDTKPKEVAFDFPGIDQFLKPWTDWKARVAEQYGLRLGFDYQPVVQWSNNTAGEDSAAGGIFRAFSSWDIWGRENPSRTGTFDLRIEHRHKIGTDLPPEFLAFNFGWIGTTAPDWTDQGWGLPIFMLRQRLDVGNAPIEVRVGRMSPFSQFDITPYSDNLTVFQNNSIILNPTIGYPSAGSFGLAGYVGIPRSKFYALGMIMDANGSYDELGFDSLEKGDFFSALEFGWTDQDVSQSLSYLFNNVHVAVWHRDAVDKPGSQSVWGLALTGSYTFAKQRLGTFVRFGRAFSDGAETLYDVYAAAGVTKDVFRASTMGLGVSWGQPPNSDTNQVATELFYKWQLSQNLALTPSIQVLFNPAANPVDDVISVFGLRLRVTL